jgi:hypothetical protein
MQRSNAARGVRGGQQQQLLADVGDFRHLERELVVRCGDYRTAATADGTAGAVQVADVLEGESGGESEGCGVTCQKLTPLRDVLLLLRLSARRARGNEEA